MHNTNIPKKLHQIWVGPLPEPKKWTTTWREKHPHWEYRLWGNEDLHGRVWRNQAHINAYAALGLWNGVADLMRYEILHEEGGFMPATDSECLNPCDELFEDDNLLYAINTGHYEGGPVVPSKIGSITPIIAARKGSPFLNTCIGKLRAVNTLFSPPNTTGNRFMQRMLRRYDPKIKIWPMHYFIPEHFNGWKYEGPDKVYARHFWGTTRNTYAQGVDA